MVQYTETSVLSPEAIVNILDIHGNPIDPLWAAEFRGFFFGEGSLEIGTVNHTYTSKGHTYTHMQLRPRARIIQRDDSSAILEAIHAKLGGSVTRHGSKKMISPVNGKGYISRPTMSWHVMSGEGVQRVLDLLKGGMLPHQKLHEITYLEAYLALRPRPGQKYTPEQFQRALDLKEALAQCRVYLDQ